MSKQLATKMAERFSVSETEIMQTLKATAFKGNVSDAQMTTLLIVADQYGLNPFTREIYAFPDRNNGIVPVVGVDGWSRIINENSQFDGMDFKQDDESCTCSIYRKDRSHPIAVTEYLSECKRDAGPWKSHPKRMLRHKAMIQCARIAFGFVGIYDEDEAQRIIEKDITPSQPEIDISAEIKAIYDCQTLEELLKVSNAAWKKYTGKCEREKISLAKDEIKELLSNPAPAIDGEWEESFNG